MIEKIKDNISFAKIFLCAFLTLNTSLLLAGDISKQKFTEQLANQLEKSGWMRNAAREYAQQNTDLLMNMEEDNNRRYQGLVSQLEELGKYNSLIETLEKKPELASLLALSEDPARLHKTLRFDHCYNAIIEGYQLIVEPSEQKKLINILEAHGDLVCELTQRNVILPFTLFEYNNKSAAVKIYKSWLSNSLRQAIQEWDQTFDNRQLLETIAVIRTQGRDILEKMEKDRMFAQQFESKLYPAFIRLTRCQDANCPTTFDLLADEPLVWDTLLQPDGGNLLKRYGLMAVYIFSDRKGFPVILRPIARDAIQSNNEQLLTSLIYFTDKDRFSNSTISLFAQLMSRYNLPPDLQEKIIQDLISRCKESDHCLTKRIGYLNSLSAKALRLEYKDPGPVQYIPFYSVYEVGEKLLNNMELNPSDYMALSEVAIVALPTGGLIRFATIGKRLPKKIKVDINKPSLSAPSIQRKEPEKIPAKPAWTGNGGIEITDMMQEVFRKSSIGRDSFKKISGQDARIFMRKDRQVIMHINKADVALSSWWLMQY